MTSMFSAFYFCQVVTTILGNSYQFCSQVHRFNLLGHHHWQAILRVSSDHPFKDLDYLHIYSQFFVVAFLQFLRYNYACNLGNEQLNANPGDLRDFW